MVRDGIADDGVVQVLGRVLIPPHEHHGVQGEEAAEVSVDELVRRLGPYVGEEETSDERGGMGDL